MKTKLLILSLIILLSSCRNNTGPVTTYGPDQMLNQYLFGSFSLNTDSAGVTNHIAHII
ncbi:MAG: hypothetical protein IPP15_05115 [Saprospiraceae bacterium]|uniref:Uncharacterized protein n=1 Tax=Candidatus Opimibacter skivensis TaxID=2982028 RepID=A0A9D7STE5_9BACT|nr:hypothetical protein [Candidatus Opimibacter skivensis]